MPMLKYIPILSLLLAAPAWAADAPESPRIDYILPSPRQPQEADAATIWYDDFNGPPKAYT